MIQSFVTLLVSLVLQFSNGDIQNSNYFKQFNYQNNNNNNNNN